jgi:hypothetical protein
MIRNWYNNNGINKGKRRTGKTQSITVSLQPASTRLLSERNLYSTKYYSTRVKQFVDLEIGDQKLDQKAIFKIMNKHLDAIYAGESDETKEEIRLELENQRKVRDEEKAEAMTVVKVDKELGPSQYLM